MPRPLGREHRLRRWFLHLLEGSTFSSPVQRFALPRRRQKTGQRRQREKSVSLPSAEEAGGSPPPAV
ncbi:hypothetical protein PSMK_20120 [Phycisphaera mikurensis NBRC 102666]|uniref:Uncharacterized protein n=1 Tax=Phycisphaera mikurensis (strain NBRC 102666 / KCTC 22515 / FYK2301M01) TaxID=1142394 RepID=I0IFY3_PHYMF|nr:hypothetical protein PSMK_20120 [Phycisphaera mikurensis NBRC 102666]